MQNVRKIFFILLLLSTSFLITTARGIKTDTTLLNVTDTLVIEETIYEYDTVFVPGDTIKYIVEPENEISREGHWSFSVKLFLYKPYANFTGNDAIETSGFELKHGKGITGHDIQFGLTYSMKHIAYSFGLGIGNYDELLYQSSEQFINDTLSFTPYFSDTALVFRNGVWVEEFVNDTLWEIETDTVESSLEARFRLSYVELPIVAGYTYNFGQMYLEMKAGIVPGLITGISHREMLNENPEDINMFSPGEYFRTFTMKGFLEAEWGYHINDNLDLSIGFHYGRSLISAYTSTVETRKHYSSVGIQFGLGYVFK